MRVFITGVTGQVGRAIAARLADQGCDVTGMSRRARQVPGLSEHVEVCLGSEKAVDLIGQALRPCEAIVHAAASLSHDKYDPSISLTNCLGTQQVTKLASLWGASQLVYISSIQVIGCPVLHPITEDHPTQPLTAYHASKLYGERLAGLAEGNGCRGGEPQDYLAFRPGYSGEPHPLRVRPSSPGREASANPLDKGLVNRTMWMCATWQSRSRLV